MKKIFNFLIPLVLSLVAVVSIFPLLLSGKSAALFNVDPDVVYIAGALSNVQSHKIYFTNHPGTPTISLLSFSYWPLRVYTKLALHQNFIGWSFDNLSALVFFCRFVFFLVFYVSISIFIKTAAF